MLYEDEEDIFIGSPRSKYLDIIFHASRSLAELELEKNIEKMAVMELLLEECLGEDKDITQIIKNYAFNNEKIVENKKRDLFIEGMGNILTQNE